MNHTTPTAPDNANDTATQPVEQTRPIGTATQRESIRYEMARRWRADGHRTWTNAQMERAIDSVMLKRRQSSLPTPSADAKPLQQTFLGADDATGHTRSMAYASSMASMNTTRETVFAHVLSCHSTGCTREEIESATGIPIQSVCPAVKAMIANGRLVQTRRTRLTRHGRAAAVVVASAWSNPCNEAGASWAK